MLQHDPILGRVLASWLGDGIEGAALVDRTGATAARAGTIADDEAMPLAALVLHRSGQVAPAERLFAGDVLTLELEERDVAVAVARRQLFVVVALGAATPHSLARVRALRDHIASYLADVPADDPLPPWGASSRGGGAGPAPARLALFVGRERAKA